MANITCCQTVDGILDDIADIAPRNRRDRNGKLHKRCEYLEVPGRNLSDRPILQAAFRSNQLVFDLQLGQVSRCDWLRCVVASLAGKGICDCGLKRGRALFRDSPAATTDGAVEVGVKCGNC